MPERRASAAIQAAEAELRTVGIALHDLCQPLTTLQCRLEMAEYVSTPEGYREAVSAGLLECERMAAGVASMRASLRASMQQLAEGIASLEAGVNR